MIKKDNFMCGKGKKVTSVCERESGKESFKAGHRDGGKKKMLILSSCYLLLLLISFLILRFLSFFSAGSRMQARATGRAESEGETREEMLSVDEEEEKARDEERRELGTRFDPCLLINLSERDRKGA